MKIETNSVVSIHYTLTGDDSEIIDSSEGQEPLIYLAGANNIVPGLDKALLGLASGDTKEVTIEPIEAYGDYDEELVQKLPKEMFGGVDDIEVGMSFEAPGPEDSVQYVEVTKVEDDGITIDGNHMLAGKTLHFSVNVVDVRAATAEELSHGHVHS